MLMVTHELGLAREVSSRVCFLHKGLIEEEGTPADLFGAPNRSVCASSSRVNAEAI